MDHIQILFKEYDVLRAEILQRSTYGYQLIALVSGALAWLVSRPVDIVFYISLMIIGAAFVTLYVLIDRDIRLTAARLRELESEINELAGKKLLKWETHWGSAVQGTWIRRRPNYPVK